LAETFTEIGNVKYMICRSLLENASPCLCTNVSLPSVEQRYYLTFLNYEKYQYSIKEVQEFWRSLFANLGIKDLLARDIIWRYQGF
jgi:hypothetical protein